MKSRFLLLLSLALLNATVLTFEGCKKYEDGPMLSLKSKKGRVDGTWKFQSFIEDGDDITQDFVGCEWEFKKDGDFTEYFDGDVYSGRWEFASDKEAIDLTYDGDTWRWSLKRLTNKEMWLERIDGGYLQDVKLSAK